MAEVLGVDLMAAIARGALTGEDWRDAVLRCTGCEDPDACMQWLASQTASPRVLAPEICRNAVLFGELRGQTRQETGIGATP